MLSHGYNAADLLETTIVSIPKDPRGCMSSSSNYRGISLCNAICKLYDIIFISKYKQLLYTSDNQFAFKSEHSTSLCTSIFTETVSYFVNRNSSVFSCLLDASKAFDNVHYGKLFELLLGRNLPPHVLRFIFDGYLRQSVNVRFNSCRSRGFSISNGVKQGGIISPILFIIYYDELIKMLSCVPYGCKVGGRYVGVLSYADDITLLAPTRNALQNMIHVCERFSNDFLINFNANKSLAIVFGTKADNCKPVSLNGNEIEWKDKVRHLGNVVNERLDDCDDVIAKKGKFLGSVNWFVGHFQHKLPINVYTKLFNTYCTSFYGSTLWNIHDNAFKDICITWNKCVRRVMAIPYTTHTALLGPIMGCVHISLRFVKRFCKFIDTMYNSSNKIVKYFYLNACYSAQSPIGRNLAMMRFKYGLSININSNGSLHDVFVCKYMCQNDNNHKSECIKELLCVINNECHIDGMCKQEVSDILNYLCCN